MCGVRCARNHHEILLLVNPLRDGYLQLWEETGYSLLLSHGQPLSFHAYILRFTDVT